MKDTPRKKDRSQGTTPHIGQLAALALAAVLASAACSSQSDAVADAGSTVVLCTDLGPFNSFDALPPGYEGRVNVCSDCVPIDSGDCDPDSGPWCCNSR